MRQIANKAQNWYDKALLPVDAMLAGGGEVYGKRLKKRQCSILRRNPSC